MRERADQSANDPGRETGVGIGCHDEATFAQGIDPAGGHAERRGNSMEDVRIELFQFAAFAFPAHPGFLRLIVEPRSEEHTSELQSLMRISYAVFCLKKKKTLKS